MSTKGIFVAGTYTCIGKTVITAGLVYLLKSQGYNHCYFKPILSGAIFEEERLILGDSYFVKMISELDEGDENITAYTFKTPVSPHMASKIGILISALTIKNRLEYLKSKYQHIIAEECGGLAVPLDYNGLIVPFNFRIGI